VIESLHFKVQGGATFERSSNSEDSCGGDLGGDDQHVTLAFFLKPPELENTVLASVIAYGVPAGKTGNVALQDVAVLTTYAIWDSDLPDPEHPQSCTLAIEKYEALAGNAQRLAGSVSCPQVLSGIGMIGMNPLTLLEWRFSLRIEPVSP
jgi:hypothetical protein